MGQWKCNDEWRMANDEWRITNESKTRINVKPETINHGCGWRGYGRQRIPKKHSTQNVKPETINATVKWRMNSIPAPNLKPETINLCILSGFNLQLFTTEEPKLGFRPRKPGCTSVSVRLFLWYFFWRGKKSTISDWPRQQCLQNASSLETYQI